MTDAVGKEERQALRRTKKQILGFRSGVVTLQKTDDDSKLLLYVKKYNEEVIAFPLLQDLLFEIP